jgi:hypothetical protein
MVFFLAGAVVAWKTRVKPTVALITAELEFLAASDTGILGLFIRAVLAELLQPQHTATTVYKYNYAFQMVADSTAPTRQMRHIAIRDFLLQDWTERNLISLTACDSNANGSPSGARGGVSVPAGSSRIPATPFHHHSLE